MWYSHTKTDHTDTGGYQKNKKPKTKLEQLSLGAQSQNTAAAQQSNVQTPDLVKAKSNQNVWQNN